MVETPTILLVESNVDDAASFGRALSDLGATLWHVETGADARAVLKDARPDLIVLDLRLRDVDGLVLCSSLRHESAEVPFMICSSGTTAEKVLAFKLGAEDFVAKPYEAAELQARVEAILTRHARKLAAKVSAAEHLTSAAQAGSWPDLGATARRPGALARHRRRPAAQSHANRIPAPGLHGAAARRNHFEAGAGAGRVGQ